MMKSKEKLDDILAKTSDAHYDMDKQDTATQLSPDASIVISTPRGALLRVSDEQLVYLTKNASERHSEGVFASSVPIRRL
jgi:hypothetical protein